MSGVATPTPLSQDALLAQYRTISGNPDATADDMFANVMGAKPTFITNETLTVDQLLVTYPASATTRGKYARVSDYGGDVTLGFSGVDRVLRCDYEQSSGLYFYTPTTPDYGKMLPVTGDIVLKGLKSPTSLVLTGTIPVGTTRNVQIPTANRRPGEVIEIRNGLTSILGTLNIIGTGIGTLVANTLGGYMRFLIDSTSGSLQLVRLQ